MYFLNNISFETFISLGTIFSDQARVKAQKFLNALCLSEGELIYFPDKFQHLVDMSREFVLIFILAHMGNLSYLSDGNGVV
jgi:hypothetical protein